MNKEKGNWATIDGGGTSKVNSWKQELGKVSPAVHEFKPLQSWPAKAHPEQERLDQFRSLPSRFGRGK